MTKTPRIDSSLKLRNAKNVLLENISQTQEALNAGPAHGVEYLVRKQPSKCYCK